MIVVIIGPDGSGKTTIANLVVAVAGRHGISAKHYAMNFNILPKLASFRRQSSTAPRNPGYDLRVNSAWRSLVYMIWYGVDYRIGGIWIRLQQFFLRRPVVAVFARYFYDYYYQSNNLKLSARVKRILEFLLVPTPCCVIFLRRNPADIYADKPELPLCEIQRQQREIVRRFSRYKGYVEIDGTGGLEPTAQRVGAVVEELFRALR